MASWLIVSVITLVLGTLMSSILMTSGWGSPRPRSVREQIAENRRLIAWCYFLMFAPSYASVVLWGDIPHWTIVLLSGGINGVLTFYLWALAQAKDEESFRLRLGNRGVLVFCHVICAAVSALTLAALVNLG